MSENNDEVSTTEDETATNDEPTRPLLRVVRGDATPEEVAALVAVVASMGAAEAPRPRRVPEWSARHRRVRTTLAHGPGGWRSSALPR
jgi:hypothetical protein